jgi:hypothetical protein
MKENDHEDPNRDPAAVLALSLAATGAVAKDKRKKHDRQERTAAAAGLTVAGAHANGAAAGGLSTAEANALQDRTRDRRDRMSTGQTTPEVNAAQTNSSGALYTTRRSAAVGVTTNGSASGAGQQSTTSTVDAYGETTRDGSSADLFGDSTATSGGRRN